MTQTIRVGDDKKEPMTDPSASVSRLAQPLKAEVDHARGGGELAG